MEVLAALNRILIFGGDNVEVVDCCDRIEALIADPTFVPSDVPLAALADATQVLANDGSKNVSLAKALCGLLSACCVGDSPTTKSYLLKECRIVEVVDGMLQGIGTTIPAAPLSTPTVTLAFHVLDLVATLSYNSGELRSAMRPVVAQVPRVLSCVLTSLCLLSTAQGLPAKYTRGAGASVDNGIVTVTGVSGDTQRSIRAHVDALFGAVTTATLLCVGDASNGAALLTQGCFTTILILYKALLPPTPPSMRRPTTSTTPTAPTLGNLVSSSFPRQALADDNKKTMMQWCEQALRNLTLAAVSTLQKVAITALPPTLEAAVDMASGGDGASSPSTFGQMGDNVDLDALKWTLQQTYRTATKKATA